MMNKKSPNLTRSSAVGLPIPTQGVDIKTDIIAWALPEGAIARLGRGNADGLAFSSNGNYLAVGNWIGVWFYELSTMKPIALWDTEFGKVFRLNFSPNGKLLAAGNWDGILKVWDLQLGTCIAEMKCPWHRFPISTADGVQIGISRIAFSGDSQYIAVTNKLNDIVYIWHAGTGEQIAELSSEPERTQAYRRFARPLCFSHDGSLLAYASPADTDGIADYISVWHVKTGENIASLKGHTSLVRSIVFSPCGKFFASHDKFGIYEWEVSTGKQVRGPSESAKNYQGRPYYSPLGELLAVETFQAKSAFSLATIVVWNVEHGEKLGEYNLYSYIRSSSFFYGNPGTGKGLKPILAVAGYQDFKVWTLDNPPNAASIEHHLLIPEFIKFSPDGQTLVSVSAYYVTCWDVAKKQLRQKVARANIEPRSVFISASNNMRVIGPKENENTVVVWDPEIDETIAMFTGHQVSVRTFAFAPTGELWVSGDIDGKMYVWDDRGKQTLLSGHTDWPEAVAFHPNGKQIASVSSGDRTLKLWDVTSGEELISLSLTQLESKLYIGDLSEIERKRLEFEDTISRPAKIRSVAFSPCGNIIAGGLLGEIRLWDATTQNIRFAILLPEGCQYPYALAFSPCGQYLASGSWWWRTKKVSIRLWNVKTGENVVTFWGHPTDIQCLTFSPDSTILASGSYDGTILLWDMKPYLRNT